MKILPLQSVGGMESQLFTELEVEKCIGMDINILDLSMEFG